MTVKVTLSNEVRKNNTPILRTSVYSFLQEGISTKRGKFDPTRRRPATVTKALTTSELSEKYTILLDKRLQIADFQIKSCQNYGEEQQLKKRLLELQIKNEEEKLKFMQHKNSFDF